MRTIRSLLSFPAALIVFMVGNLLFSIAGRLYNNISNYNDGIHSFGLADIILTYLIIYIGQSIIPVVISNVIMFLLLDGEDRAWLSLFLKVLFATFGSLLFSMAIYIRFVTGIEFIEYIAGYLLTIASFIATPMFISYKIEELTSAQSLR